MDTRHRPPRRKTIEDTSDRQVSQKKDSGTSGTHYLPPDSPSRVRPHDVAHKSDAGLVGSDSRPG
jgi:hypothetical protein